jgi:hypothetical protein
VGRDAEGQQSLLPSSRKPHLRFRPSNFRERCLQVCCLDNFTIFIKAKAPTAVRLMTVEFRLYLRDVFDSVPLTNVNSESRFAAVHTRSLSNHGHPVDGVTLASDHVLMESKMTHDVQVSSQRDLEALRIRHVPEAIPNSGWKLYIQIERKDDESLRECGVRWHSLTDKEKESWATRARNLQDDVAAQPAKLRRVVGGVWPPFGDDSYPLSEKTLLEAEVVVLARAHLKVDGFTHSFFEAVENSSFSSDGFRFRNLVCFDVLVCLMFTEEGPHRFSLNGLPHIPNRVYGVKHLALVQTPLLLD